MSAIEFSKFHGFGNDYIVIEREAIPIVLPLDALAREMCDRHTGVGSDGLAIIEQIDSANADFECEIVNPDGSIAGFSGNGTRCAVAYLHHAGAWSAESLLLKTRSGVKNYRLIQREGEANAGTYASYGTHKPYSFWFGTEIGEPKFSPEEIPLNVTGNGGAVVNEPIEIDGEIYSFSTVNVGNPVACIFVDTFDFDWRSVGRAMETQSVFPDRVNAVFVRVIDTENIELRIWERGAGETSASGTCSAGAAVLSAFLLKTHRTVNVHSPGGTTRVVWRDDGEIVLTGRADFAFSGRWPIK